MKRFKVIAGSLYEVKAETEEKSGKTWAKTCAKCGKDMAEADTTCPTCVGDNTGPAIDVSSNEETAADIDSIKESLTKAKEKLANQKAKLKTLKKGTKAYDDQNKRIRNTEMSIYRFKDRIALHKEKQSNKAKPPVNTNKGKKNRTPSEDKSEHKYKVGTKVRTEDGVGVVVKHLYHKKTGEPLHVVKTDGMTTTYRERDIKNPKAKFRDARFR